LQKEKEIARLIEEERKKQDDETQSRLQQEKRARTLRIKQEFQQTRETPQGASTPIDG
jgi:hypothetical protein